MLLPPVLLADALCYSLWVLVLFSTGSFAPRFNRWTAPIEAVANIRSCPRSHRRGPADMGGTLLWLGLALLVGSGRHASRPRCRTSTMLTQTSWTVLFATRRRVWSIARTPLARIPGPAPLASALLALLVAVLGIAE